VRANSLSKKPWSNRTLCATSTAPSSSFKSCGATSSKPGALATKALLMPVSCSMKLEMCTPGLTSVLQRATSTPFSKRTAAISVM